MEGKVLAMQNMGNKNRVSGTPTFFINGKMLVGAQPYSAFQQEIDAALAK
jgi:protein-disulfide isomerase